MNNVNPFGAEDLSPLEITQASLLTKEDPHATKTPATMSPGDHVPPDSPGAAETICPECGGTGRNAGTNTACNECEGIGKVTVGVGGG